MGLTAAELTDLPDPPFAVVRPRARAVPVVFASPHSGSVYPRAFVAAARLDKLTLRRSEDAFVDELFAGVPDRGAPLLRAFFPRSFVDPNREAWELDPVMFADALPDFVNARSARVSAGIGTIARVVANGAEIYHGKLRFADARARIELCYRPYHDTLRRLLDETAAQFGRLLLVDCHSMPSVGGPLDRDAGRRRVDMVLGDCHGTSCAPALVGAAESCLRDLGYRVARNEPYAGGFTTRHYGQPDRRRHALQIEINRSLYMDEDRVERGGGFAALGHDLERFAQALIDTMLGDPATR